MLKVRNHSKWLPQATNHNFVQNTVNVNGDVLQAQVIQRLDNSIHWIKRYPLDSVIFFSLPIHWIAIYTANSVIRP